MSLNRERVESVRTKVHPFFIRKDDGSDKTKEHEYNSVAICANMIIAQELKREHAKEFLKKAHLYILTDDHMHNVFLSDEIGAVEFMARRYAISAFIESVDPIKRKEYVEFPEMLY